jgi:hypothetical protein
MLKLIGKKAQKKISLLIMHIKKNQKLAKNLMKILYKIIINNRINKIKIFLMLDRNNNRFLKKNKRKNKMI